MRKQLGQAVSQKVNSLQQLEGGETVSHATLRPDAWWAQPNHFVWSAKQNDALLQPDRQLHKS